MPTPEAVDSLGTLTVRSAVVSSVNAGKVGSSASLSLRGYDPADTSNHTTVTLSNDGAIPSVVLSSNLGNVVLGGLALPTSSTHAISKGYADSLLEGTSAKNTAAAIIEGAFVPVGSSGSSFSIDGTVTFDGDTVTLGTDLVIINGVTIHALGVGATSNPEITRLAQHRVLVLAGSLPSAIAGVYFLLTSDGDVAVFARCADMSSGNTATNELKLGSHLYAGPAMRGYSISALSDDPPVLGTSTITFSPLYTEPRRLGPSTEAEVDGDYANLLTVRDPGAHDGSANAGGLVLEGPASWPEDGSITSQAIYHANPSATGSMRTLLQDRDGASPLFCLQRWDGAAWSSVFTASA